jgi:hypothetical protein
MRHEVLVEVSISRNRCEHFNQLENVIREHTVSVECFVGADQLVTK